MEVSKRLEVDFQQISIPWKCPKGWKLTSNKFPYHGSVQKVGSGLPTNFHTMEVSKRLEVSWKFVGSRNDFHDLERTRFFQCYRIKQNQLNCGRLLPRRARLILIFSDIQTDFSIESLPLKYIIPNSTFTWVFYELCFQ